MKKMFVGLIMGLLLTVFTVCFASAEGPRGAGLGHPVVGVDMDHPLWLDLPRLNIDRNRMDAIREIEIRTVKEGIRKRAELQMASIELGELLRKDPVDLKAVETKLKQMAVLKTDLHLARIKAIEEIKGKLTSEERRKLREFLDTAHMRPQPPHDGMAGPAPCDQPPASGKPMEEKKVPRAKEKVR